MPDGQILKLATYPIKGLSAVQHQSVAIGAGAGFPVDRAFGFAKRNSGFDPANPQPMPKDRFVVLLQHAKLAGLATDFDHQTKELTVRDSSGSTSSYCLDRGDDCDRIARYLIDLLGLLEEETPVFLSADPNRFTDVSVVSKKMMHAISLLNWNSVEAFGQAISRDVDPGRFRANILFDGWPPFHELDLVGEIIHVGGVAFRVLKRTQRCAATEVDPQTGERNLPVPYLLRKTYGHLDMGIYAEALEDGCLTLGAAITANR